MEVKGTPHEFSYLLFYVARGPPPRPGALPCCDALTMAAPSAVQVCSGLVSGGAWHNAVRALAILLLPQSMLIWSLSPCEST